MMNQQCEHNLSKRIQYLWKTIKNRILKRSYRKIRTQKNLPHTQSYCILHKTKRLCCRHSHINWFVNQYFWKLDHRIYVYDAHKNTYANITNYLWGKLTHSLSLYFKQCWVDNVECWNWIHLMFWIKSQLMPLK